LSLIDSEGVEVKTSLLIDARGDGPPPVEFGLLPSPDLSVFDGRTYSILDELVLPNADPSAQYKWDLIPESVISGLNSPTSPAASPTAAPVLTNAPRMSLAGKNYPPGAYILLVQMIKGDVESSWASARITLVSATLGNLRVYPNPWRQDKHAGLDITFAGAPAGATLKLFTVSGYFVRELENASPLLWDRRNSQGEPVASGLYLFVVTTPDGTQRTGKLAVIR
jgi:hypothetical protein